MRCRKKFEFYTLIFRSHKVLWNITHTIILSGMKIWKYSQVIILGDLLPLWIEYNITRCTFLNDKKQKFFIHTTFNCLEICQNTPILTCFFFSEKRMPFYSQKVSLIIKRFFFMKSKGLISKIYKYKFRHDSRGAWISNFFLFILPNKSYATACVHKHTRHLL